MNSIASTMENKQLDAALYYLNKCGFSVIPAKEDKRPYIQWQQFQKEKPPESVVRKWWGDQYKFANIAIITGKVSNLTVIDIDTSEGKQKIEELLPESFITPIVDTPSGGEHIYCQYEEGVGNAVRFMPGCDIRSEGGYVIAPPSSDKRGAWKWREGCKIGSLEVAHAPVNVIERIIAFNMCGSNVNAQKALENVSGIRNSYIDFSKGSRDNTIFHVAHCLKKGGMPQQEIEQLLIFIAKNCNPPFPESEIAIKIKSASRRVEEKQRNLAGEILEWVRYIGVSFSVRECYEALEIVSKAQKNNARQAFHKMSKDGIVERDTKIPGIYHVRDKSEQEIKWWDAGTKELGYRLIFDLQEYVKMYPRNIIVLAGSPNAGKTALMLNMAKLFLRENKNISFFSSEMDAIELNVRLSLMDPPELEEMRKIRFLQRNRNFQDVIDPNGINIIDFFEITDRFFAIAEEFKSIWNKLDQGIAIIALQKDPGKKVGRGATFSLEIPRLYLTVDYAKGRGHVLKVVKAKNWRGENPNGFMRYFRIRQGINLYPEGIWEPEI